MSADTATSTEWTRAAKLAKTLGGTLLVKEVGSLPIGGQLQLVREMQDHDDEVAKRLLPGPGAP